jgi:hypothetical protein
MADQWPALAIYDGDFTVPEPVGLPIFQSPIRATTAEYIFTQDWMQALKDYKPAALNTPHPSAGQTPDYSAFVLVAEGPRQDMGGGIVKWQRTYAKLPASHDEFESYAYPFIGLAGAWTVGNQSSVVTATGRGRTSHVVTSRVQHDYFLVRAPSTAGDIPILKALRYFAGALPGPNTGLETDFVIDETGAVPASSPSRAQYLAWMANATTYGFRGGAIVSNDSATWTAVVNPSQFIAEDSRLTRWQGSIWQRQTRFILAQ